MKDEDKQETIKKIIEGLQSKGIVAKVIDAETLELLQRYYTKGFYKGFISATIITIIVTLVVLYGF